MANKQYWMQDKGWWTSEVNSLEEVSRAFVEIVWEPPWNPEMMSEAAKLELGFLLPKTFLVPSIQAIGLTNKINILIAATTIKTS